MRIVSQWRGMGGRLNPASHRGEREIAAGTTFLQRAMRDAPPARETLPRVFDRGRNFFPCLLNSPLLSRSTPHRRWFYTSGQNNKIRNF